MEGDCAGPKGGISLNPSYFTTVVVSIRIPIGDRPGEPPDAEEHNPALNVAPSCVFLSRPATKLAGRRGYTPRRRNWGHSLVWSRPPWSSKQHSRRCRSLFVDDSQEPLTISRLGYHVTLCLVEPFFRLSDTAFHDVELLSYRKAGALFFGGWPIRSVVWPGPPIGFEFITEPPHNVDGTPLRPAICPSTLWSFFPCGQWSHVLGGALV